VINTNYEAAHYQHLSNLLSFLTLRSAYFS